MVSSVFPVLVPTLTGTQVMTYTPKPKLLNPFPPKTLALVYGPAGPFSFTSSTVLITTTVTTGNRTYYLSTHAAFPPSR